jgi:predicted nucleic acid-binding protein
LSFYLDNSVLVPLFVAEARSEAIQHWLEECERPVHVSDLAISEFNATMSGLVRTKDYSREQARAQAAAFERWRLEFAEPTENLPVDVRLASKLVAEPFPKLLTPGAIHLATCKRMELTLVSDDKRLIEIAGRLSVDVISPPSIRVEEEPQPRLKPPR